MKFSNFHPATLLIFFTSVITFTMITMNPVLLLLSFLCAFFSVLKINRKTDIGFYVILFVAISITNPIFSHNGETVLFYLVDQRITLEALFYGMAAAVRIIAVIYWFKLFSKVFTQDKLNWFLGRLSPKLAVVFSMALRFVPLVKNHAQDIYNAQISLGTFNKNLSGRFKLLCNVFSALISMSTENAIDTADTMRSRGFENKNRTAYSRMIFSTKDFFILVYILILDCINIPLFFCKVADFYYYPAMKFAAFNEMTILCFITYTMICIIPLLNDCLEDLRWKYLISKI